MMRIVSPRSVYPTTSKRPRDDAPNVTQRSSPKEWSGSRPVVAKESPNTVVASSKDTPCFRSLSLALPRSHVNRNPHPLGGSNGKLAYYVDGVDVRGRLEATTIPRMFTPAAISIAVP